MKLIDPRMREDGFVEKDVLRAITAAFLCLQPCANLRPPMSEIVAILTCRADIVKTPIRQAAFSDRRSRKDDGNCSWDSISEPFPSPLQSDSHSSLKPLY